MDWAELSRWLTGDLEEITGEIAYRSALRVFPLVATDLDKTWRSREDRSPRLLIMLRALITMQVVNDNPNVNLRSTLARIFQQFGSVDAYDYVSRAVRAACNLHTLPNRRTRYEELRKTLQAAKDGSRNISPSGVYRKAPYFTLDTWDEVAKDTRRLSTKPPSVPPYVIDDPAAIAGSWQDLSDHLNFYNEQWLPWLKWLDFRLFGSTSDRLTLDDWRTAELALASADDILWLHPQRLNDHFSSILQDLSSVGEDRDAEPEVEDQNPGAIMFAPNELGQIDLDRSPNTSGLPEPADPLYLEILTTATSLVEDPSDNSAALLRDRVTRYRDALLGLHQVSGPAVLVVRGETLRLLKEAYDREDDSLDLAPLTDQARLCLNELVGQHNVLVGVNSGLAVVDKLLRQEAADELLNVGELKSLVESARTQKVTTDDAQGALEAAVDQAAGQHQIRETTALRASESGKNLIRLAMKQMWNYKRGIGIAAVSVPPALYALGKWALANEAILVTYFRTSPGMHEAIQRIFEWLHTLPLL